MQNAHTESLNEIILAEIQKQRYLQVPAMILCYHAMGGSHLYELAEPERVERALFGLERRPSTIRDKDRWVMQNASEQRREEAQVQLDQLLAQIILDHAGKTPGFFAGTDLTGDLTVRPDTSGSASLLRNGDTIAEITPSIRFNQNGAVYVWFALTTLSGETGYGWSTGLRC